MLLVSRKLQLHLQGHCIWANVVIFILQVPSMSCFTFLAIMKGGLENKLEHFMWFMEILDVWVDVVHGDLGMHEQVQQQQQQNGMCIILWMKFHGFQIEWKWVNPMLSNSWF
jgi:hypothetical protein